MPELLKVDQLSAGYGEAVVLNGVSLSLDEVQTLSLLGRNGTGKTTLINTLAGATRMSPAASCWAALRCIPCRRTSGLTPA